MKNINFLVVCLLFLVVLHSCKKDGSETPPVVTVTSVKISCDKAAYNPGEVVKFSVDKAINGIAKIRYRHLSEVINEVAYSGASWNWTAPSANYTGYLVDIYKMNDDGTEHIYGSIAVDVSSDWTRFPRYGFLTDFTQLTETSMNSLISNLARHHLNGLQFFDWHYAHHKLLSGTPSNPDQQWKSISNSDVHLNTVKRYIELAHSHNIRAMSYNLCYGALNNAASDGVADEWYMFTDPTHTSKDVFYLPSPMFKSNIWLLDPSNSAWQAYIAGKNRDVYQVLDFDGYHIDQLGDRNNPRYTFNGQTINLVQGFGSFINAMKADQPGKFHLFNAVNQYGQQNIAQAPVDFLYTEVWNPNEGYKDLAAIINDNNAFSGNTKNTVLAAYMNYDMAYSPGFFNTPGVLLTNAVIFSFGGSHIELGEHMLGQEYFPNDNLQMKGDLRDAMLAWYDFLVAYENLLRDEGTGNSPVVSCTDYQFSTNVWPPQFGKVSVSGREVGERQVIHLINFSNATSLNWRDKNGTQPYPVTYQKVKIACNTTKMVQKVWVASPDYKNGTPVVVNYTQSAGSVAFELPYLKYWTMIVIE